MLLMTHPRRPARCPWSQFWSQLYPHGWPSIDQRCRVGCCGRCWSPLALYLVIRTSSRSVSFSTYPSDMVMLRILTGQALRWTSRHFVVISAGVLLLVVDILGLAGSSPVLVIVGLASIAYGVFDLIKDVMRDTRYLEKLYSVPQSICRSSRSSMRCHTALGRCISSEPTLP